MNLLVTGGAGYIGAVVAKKLLSAGHQVTVFDSLITGFREAVPAGADFVQGDIRDREALQKIFSNKRFDGVFHFASLIVAPESVEKALEYYDVNLGGGVTLLETCREYGVKHFIFSSTASVYGSTNEAVSEESPLAPANPYGASKAMMESVLRDVSQASPLKHVILRYFNVAGASPDLSNGQRLQKATHLIKIASQAAVGIRDHVVVAGSDYPTKDGTGVRDYIHVEDLADAHVLALNYLAGGGASTTLNCGYGHGSSVREVLQAMKKASGVDFEIREGARRPGDTAEIVAKADRIRAVLGWTPKYDDLEFICKTAFEWEKTRI